MGGACLFWGGNTSLSEQCWISTTEQTYTQTYFCNGGDACQPSGSGCTATDYPAATLCGNECVTNSNCQSAPTNPGDSCVVN
jgi:hypothetical protein